MTLLFLIHCLMQWLLTLKIIVYRVSRGQLHFDTENYKRPYLLIHGRFVLSALARPVTLPFADIKLLQKCQNVELSCPQSSKISVKKIIQQDQSMTKRAIMITKNISKLWQNSVEATFVFHGLLKSLGVQLTFSEKDQKWIIISWTFVSCNKWKQAVREAATICPRTLQDDLWPFDL